MDEEELQNDLESKANASLDAKELTLGAKFGSFNELKSVLECFQKAQFYVRDNRTLATPSQKI